MLEGEAERCLVDCRLVDRERVVDYQEAREILLERLDVLAEHLETEHPGGKVGSHRSDAHQMALGYVRGALGRVLALHHPDPWTFVLEEFTGLVDRHVVRPDLLDVLDPLAGDGHEILLYPDIDLAFDLLWMFPQKLEIRDQSA